MVSFEESKLHLETPSTSRSTSSYKDISNYKDHRQKMSQADLAELRNIVGFKQIRFYCHKKKVGTVVHFMTNVSPLGEAVAKYFIDSNRELTRPQACGSYTILTDDSSKLTKSCSKLGWNGTHADGKWSSPSGGEPLLKPMQLRGKFRFHSFPSRRDCDDWKSTDSSLSAGDTWAVFVR